MSTQQIADASLGALEATGAVAGSKPAVRTAIPSSATNRDLLLMSEPSPDFVPASRLSNPM
jgi:hypothetical protein